MVMLKRERRPRRVGGVVSRGERPGRVIQGAIPQKQDDSDRHPDLWAVEVYIATGAIPACARPGPQGGRPCPAQGN